MQFLASVLPADTDPEFFQHLRSLDCSAVTLRALPEGSLAFPGVSAGGALPEGNNVAAGELHYPSTGALLQVSGLPLVTLSTGAPTAGVRSTSASAASGDSAPLSGQLCQVGLSDWTWA